MSDYNFLLESRLSPAQLQVVNYLSRVAYATGLNLYLVGGAVRDLTSGLQEIKDLDFALEGDPQKLLRQFAKARTSRGRRKVAAGSDASSSVSVKSIRFDRRLNACDVEFTPGLRVEIAQCRRETYLRPGRPPQVRPATVFEDLRRRDFAANAMAISLHPNSRGLILDPANGGGDIERRELRALHSRGFVEDPSRIFRILRLGLRLGFKPEEKTQRWLTEAIESRLWMQLDPAAQAHELAAVLREENPARSLKYFADRGLLTGLDRKLNRIPYDRFHRIRAAAERLPETDPFVLNFHSLVSKLGRGQQTRLARKVLQEPDAIRLALSLERVAKKVARQLSSAKGAVPSQAYKLLQPVPKPVLLFLLVYVPLTKVQSRLKNYLFKAPQLRARLPRAELEAMGIKSGPKFEQIMNRVFFDQLDGKIRTPQQLTKGMRALAGIKEPPKPPAKPEKSPSRADKGSVKGERGIPRKEKELPTLQKHAPVESRVRPGNPHTKAASRGGRKEKKRKK